MTVRKGRLAVALVATIIAVAGSFPVLADTSDEIHAQRERLATLQQELNRLVARYDEAQARLAETEARMEELQERVARLRSRVGRLRESLSARAREAYRSGGAGTLELLLDSSSLSEFSDRAAFLGHLSQMDSDLLVQASVTNEQLRRAENDLAALAGEQESTVAALRADRSAIAAHLSEASAVLADLQARLDRERAAAAARERARREAAASVFTGGGGGGGSVPPTGSGVLQVCPTGRPRAFSNTFGAPRSGGRSHQGIDIMAPLGTPVYAAHSGRFQANSNALGGLSALVYGPSGYTYYAHLSSYAGVSSGAGVSAGTMIGRVGDTGNAPPGVYHLHFEWHPGGGGAVNPFGLLLAVC